MPEGLLVWILQTGEPLHLDEGNLRPMRAMNLANTLTARGHRVVLWSADFDHFQKRFRNRADQPIEIEPDLEIRLLPSSGYKCNIGFGRLFDHAVLGYNLRKRLRTEFDLPDVAFVGYPPIETAYVLTRWLRARRIPVMLDIKDQWPVIFAAALPRLIRPLGSLVFYPYTFMAKRVMRSATAVSAMADGFVDWALDYCGRERTDRDRAYPLTTAIGDVTGTELQQAQEWWDRQGLGDEGVNKVYFVGSFSSAFDFTLVKDAARAAAAAGDKLQFVLCGDGGNAEEVKAMMAGLENVIFPGWIDRPRIEALAQRCIVSIAPYRNTPDFMLSIPNKIIDSLALGLPVLTPLEGEVAGLIDTHGVGIKYGDQIEVEKDSLYSAIKRLVDDPELQKAMSQNAHELYKARFLFERVYGDLASHLEQLAIQLPGISSDKNLERERYEQRAKNALTADREFQPVQVLDALPAALRAPYEAYLSEISSSITTADMKVLEIGAGTGFCSEKILQTGARFVATDISESALAVLKKQMQGFANLETRVADMEALPFAGGTFDVVLSAGSLSYGDNGIVMQEIYRVLKPGGKFICVDSLNHNPIYRLNRWIHYLRGNRTRSTIERMPTQKLVQQYRHKFGRAREQYFGSITWAVPLLRIFLADETIARISLKVDRLVGVSKSAFKLVLVAEKTT